jgi:hypothetical protein
MVDEAKPLLTLDARSDLIVAPSRLALNVLILGPRQPHRDELARRCAAALGCRW